MPQSITIVQADGTIWTSAEFTQVTPPTPEQIQIVDVAAGEKVEVVNTDAPAA